MPQQHVLSPTAHARLKAEMEELTGEGRIEIAKKIEAARALGDLSENGDYHAAKEEQGKMEARIRDLQALLLDAEIIGTSDTDSVSPGHVVAICYEGDDEPERFLIGSIEEKGADLDVLTPGSPLGRTLLGARVGDWLEFESPTGAVLKVEVVEIEG
jgi:transcription elongation factor GreA